MNEDDVFAPYIKYPGNLRFLQFWGVILRPEKIPFIFPMVFWGSKGSLVNFPLQSPCEPGSKLLVLGMVIQPLIAKLIMGI